MKNPYKILKGLPVIYVDENTIIYGPNVYKKCGKAIDLNDWPKAKKQWEDVINGSGDFADYGHGKEKRPGTAYIHLVSALIGGAGGLLVYLIGLAII